MDEDGYLTIVDRAKDMISVGGFKVFPREVEEKFYEHPAIDVCALIGVQNPERPETELVKLVVQKNAAYADTPEDQLKDEIIAFAREKVLLTRSQRSSNSGKCPSPLRVRWTKRP